MDLPVILYGAGGRAEYEKEQAENLGLKIACFVDADPKKQGRSYLDLPILSLAQAKDRHGKFYVYLTPTIEKHGEIIEYLLKNGIKQEFIINAAEECHGCRDLDSKLNVFDLFLYSCCQVNESMNDPPRVYWENSGWDMESAIDAYIAMRDDLSRSIKSGIMCRCTGCSSIKNESRPVNKVIKQLIFNYDYPCQLSCIYCEHENAGNKLRGDEDKGIRFAREFDYKRFVEILERRRLLADDALIILAGGEITIHPRLDEILDAIDKYKLEVFTNAIVYNERIAMSAAKPGGGMLISVDAGTKQTYKLIKGMDAFDKVWANIKMYTDRCVNVRAKYVFIEENSNAVDIEGFIREAAKSGVNEIRLSANYLRQRQHTAEQYSQMARMIGLAEKNMLKAYFESTLTDKEQSLILQIKHDMSFETPHIEGKWDDYYHIAEDYTDMHFSSFLFPMIEKHRFPLEYVLDFPCGRGRIAEKLYLRYGDAIIRIALCDANTEAVDFCRKRFAGNDSFDYAINEVEDEQCIALNFQDSEFSFIYSWDAMVHFSYEWLDFYIGEFFRIAKPSGYALIHHSNLGSDEVCVDLNKSSNWKNNPYWRSIVSREDVGFIARKHGFGISDQTVIDWVIPKLDCITVLRKP